MHQHHHSHNGGNTMGFLRGIGLGVTLGCAIGAVGGNYVTSHKRTVRKNMNKVLHTASDWLEGVTSYF